MEVKLVSDNQEFIRVFSSPNGMKIIFNNPPKTFQVSIDQAAEMAVAILTHVDEMAKKHLG